MKELREDPGRTRCLALSGTDALCMAVGGVPLWQKVLSAGLMLAVPSLTVCAVSRAIRVQMILSGQPQTPGRYFRALLGIEKLALRSNNNGSK
jgi:hypothetical protein